MAIQGYSGSLMTTSKSPFSQNIRRFKFVVKVVLVVLTVVCKISVLNNFNVQSCVSSSTPPNSVGAGIFTSFAK